MSPTARDPGGAAIQARTGPGAPAQAKESPRQPYDMLAAGRALYQESGCDRCHGKQGRGDGPEVRGLRQKPTSFASLVTLPMRPAERGARDDRTALIIKEGGRAAGKSRWMPAYKDKLTDEQMREVMEYLWSIERDAAGPAADRLIADFAAAVNRRDWEGALALADPVELELIGLTPGNAPAYFKACTAWTGGNYRLVLVEKVVYAPGQGRYERAAHYRVCDVRGVPLASAQRQVVVQALRTSDGWRITVGPFASSLLRAGQPRDRRPKAGARGQMYAQACAAAGVRPWLSSGDGCWYYATRPAEFLSTAEVRQRLKKK